MKKMYEIKLTDNTLVIIFGWCAGNAIDNSGYYRHQIIWCKPV